MMETLPRILQARAFEPDTTFVTSSAIHPRYASVLDAWRVKVERLPPGSVVSPSTAILIDQPELFWPRPTDINTIRSAFGVDTTLDGASESIYISRRRANRSISGEDELERFLSGRGYRPVLLEDMSVDEQVRLFAKTRSVIAPHGAGLSGIAFMPSGAKVIEITTGELFENCYRRMAAIRSLDYMTCLAAGGHAGEFGRAADIIEAVAALAD